MKEREIKMESNLSPMVRQCYALYLISHYFLLKEGRKKYKTNTSVH